MHPIFHMLQKELLQHKIVTRLPLFVLVFSLIIIALLMYGLNTNIEFKMEGAGQSDLLNIQKGYSSFIVFGTTVLSYLLTIVYLSKAITNDRKERAFIFWRSMPVSDLSTHLVKLSFALLVIPIICSALILSSEIFLWLISLFSPEHIRILIGASSLSEIIHSYFKYLFHILIIGVALLPFSCLVFSLSQLYDSPLLIALIGIYAFKIISAVLFSNSGIDQYFYQLIDLPTSLVLTGQPIQLISELPIFNIFILCIFAIMFFVLSLHIQKHGELNFKNLLK